MPMVTATKVISSRTKNMAGVFSNMPIVTATKAIFWRTRNMAKEFTLLQIKVNM